MLGRLWSRCLSVWIGNFQRIFTWSFLTTFFWSCPPVFIVLQVVFSTYGPVYYFSHIAMSLSVLNPCELTAATGDMCHGFWMLFAQPAFQILHSVVDLVCHCPGIEGLLLSCHDQSLSLSSSGNSSSCISSSGNSSSSCINSSGNNSSSNICISGSGNSSSGSSSSSQWRILRGG